MRELNLKILATVTVLGVSAQSWADSLSAIHENNVGVEQIENERPREAEATFLKALTEDPFNAEIRYNLGTSYLMQKKFDRALKEYQAVLRQKDLHPELAFVANFNAAIAAQELNNVDLALDHYQAALMVKPDSLETKKNIELLLASQSGKPKQGQGQGQGDPNDDNQNGQGQQPKDQNPNDQPNNKPQNGQNFSKDELKKIFEELERQEQKVRALEYGTKGGREKGPSKDW